ncbi:hypothetical protein ACHAW6_008001 [Cyclotella cf. meneghiniana]
MNHLSDNDNLVAIEPAAAPPPTSRYHATRLYNLLPSQHDHNTTIGAALTSSAVLNCLMHRLQAIRDSSVTVNETTLFAAATATAQVLFNGATGISLPDTDTWICAYADDPETALIRQMIEHPHTITKDSLSKLHYVYRGLICRSQIVIMANSMLALHEPLESTDDPILLQLVP